MKKVYVKRKTNGQYAARYSKVQYALLWVTLLIALMFGAWVIKFIWDNPRPTEFVSPIPEVEAFQVTPTPTQYVPRPTMEGTASWYGEGEDECLGCNEGRIMANGQRLDDDALTVACGVGGSCKMFPLGTRIKIINLKNQMTVNAVVTDTGGFAKYNRILDVSKAVRDRLNMGGMGEVRVSRL